MQQGHIKLIKSDGNLIDTIFAQFYKHYIRYSQKILISALAHSHDPVHKTGLNDSFINQTDPVAKLLKLTAHWRG